MDKEMYDIMPIAEIHTPKEQCNQIGKRNAKKAIESLIYDCDHYGTEKYLEIADRLEKIGISKSQRNYFVEKIEKRK